MPRKHIYSVFLRWDPHGDNHSAYGKGYVNYLGEVEAPTLADAKTKAEEFQRDYDLGYLEVLLTKGTVQKTFSERGRLENGCVHSPSSAIYHYPSRTKEELQWSKLAPKGAMVIGEIVQYQGRIL